MKIATRRCRGLLRPIRTYIKGVALSFHPLRADSLIHGSNKRKAIKENTKPNFQKALGSLTSIVMDVGAHSAIYVSPPESSMEIIVARIVH